MSRGATADRRFMPRIILGSAPTVSSITPNNGSHNGGTAVTIAGTGFRPGANLEIGGVQCTSIVWVSSISITAVTGAHVAGSGLSAKVYNPDGQSASGGTYQFT